MTDTQTPPSTGAPRMSSGGLVRPRDHVLGGVAGAIASALGAEVTVVRVALVVLGFFTAGAVVPFYLAGWLLLPEEGEPAGTTVAGRFSTLPTWIKVVAVISLVSVAGSVGSPGLGFGALLLGVGWLLFREDERRRGAGRTDPPSPSPVQPAGSSQGPGWDPPGGHYWPPPNGGWRPSAWADDDETGARGGTSGGHASAPPGLGGAATAAPGAVVDVTGDGSTVGSDEAPELDPLWDGFPWTLPPELRDDASPAAPPAAVATRPVLGRLTLGLSLVGLAFTGLLDRIGAVAPSFQDYLAIVLVCCGLGLLVGARRGRSRGLLVVAVLLGAVLLLPDFPPAGARGLGGGVGERMYVPTTAPEAAQGYELGIGQQTVDLTRLDADDLERPLVVEATQSIGEMVVIVPPDTTVEVDATVRAGELNYFDRQASGDSPELEQTFAGEEGAGRLVLDLSMGLGEIRLERGEAQ